MARCIKFTHNGETKVGEVRYFCQMGPEGTRRAVALVSCFGPVDIDVYRDSYKTVEMREYSGDADLLVIDVKSIKNVVGMVPDDMPEETDYTTDYTHLHVGLKYVVVEKLGFSLDVLVGTRDPEMDMEE
ncbi:hypothetical protein ACG7TL_002132 [Trametes sanguinea]